MENTENPKETTPGENDSELTFGKYLKQVRRDKGLSIEDIMDDTRISKYVIQQIEAENLGNLPEDVYLKGFIKSYAEAVGVDPKDVLEKYKMAKGRNDSHQSPAKKEHTASSGSGFPVAMILGVVIIVSVLVLVILYTKGKYITPITEPDTVVEMNESVDVVTEPEIPVQEEPPQDTIAEDGYHLEVLCVEATTLKITIDGGLPEEYMLNPEDHLELKAEKMYTIMIDNTCGVTMMLNNNSVSVPGKCGQTATIQLP